MKKIAIAFSLILTTAFTVNAQEEDRLKPVDGDWGFSLNISGIINNIVVENNKDSMNHYNLFARHYLKDDLALRLGFGTTYLNNNTFNEDSVTIASGNRALQTVDSTTSRFDFKVSVGIEKHLGTTRRLDPYVGADLSIIRLGATKTDVDIEQIDVTGTANESTSIQNDGGAGFGLGAIAGFNYFLSKNLSIGAEFGYAYSYIKTGGDYSISKQIQPVSGTDTNTSEFGKASQTSTSIGATATGGIMLSFFF